MLTRQVNLCIHMQSTWLNFRQLIFQIGNKNFNSVFSSRFMVLMLLGSIVTGPQRAWLSGSPVAQSVIFMPGRLFQRCYANRWTSLTPGGPLPCLQRCFLFSPLLAMSRAPLFTSFCTTSSSKMVALLKTVPRFFLSCRLGNKEPQILALVLNISLVSIN